MATDNSSLTKQTDFVAAVYNATLPHSSRIALMNWLPLADIDASAFNYGINNPQFIEYLGMHIRMVCLFCVRLFIYLAFISMHFIIIYN